MGSKRAAAVRRRGLRFEQLEQRRLLATFNVPWPTDRLTVSFAPDGTLTHQGPSQLESKLTGEVGAAWRDEVLRAFQTWSAPANVDFALVSDDGADFGALGQMVDDPRFGDVRIGAAPLGDDVVAISIPYSQLAGTWSGDILLNSNYPFTVGDEVGKFNLFTVMLHEVGHVLGHQRALADEGYDGPLTGLAATEEAFVLDLYDPRSNDSYEREVRNDRPATATPLQAPDRRARLIGANASIADATDVDYYEFTPTSDKDITIRLRTVGWSLLVPRLTILDENGKVLRVKEATGHQNVLVTLEDVEVGETIRVRVGAAARTHYSSGGYRLELIRDRVKPRRDDLDFDELEASTLATAFDLETDTHRAELSDSEDADFFHVLTPPEASTAGAMVVTVRSGSDEDESWDPLVRVYDAQGMLVTANVLRTQAGEYAVEVANPAPLVEYYLEVLASRPDSIDDDAVYTLSLQYSQAPTPQHTFVADAVSAARPVVFRTLDIHTTELFYFRLSASGGESSRAVRMSILDATATVVESIEVAPGAVHTLLTTLERGTYQVVFQAIGAQAAAAQPTRFELSGDWLSDPIGPRPIDTTLDAAGTRRSTTYMWRIDPTAIYNILVRYLPANSGPWW